MSFGMNQVTVGYAGRPVLSQIDLAPVEPGTLVAVLGPNAVGKSTLLKAIAGLIPAGGRMPHEGSDLLTLAPRDRRDRVSYMPQSLPQANSLVTYELMSSGLHVSRPEWTKPQREAAIDDVMHRLGLAPLALRRLDELSGGQRQMISLAQVIVRKPRLLLLDEPTSALDLRWQLQVLQTVQALAQSSGLIALVALHDLNLALRFCQRAIILGNGSVQASGAPAELLTPELMARVWGVRARVEHCTQGHPMLLADAALPLSTFSEVSP